MTLEPTLALAWNPAVGVPLLIVGLIVLAAIWLLGQPKKEQGVRRDPLDRADTRRDPFFGGDQAPEHDGRREPTLGGFDAAQDAADPLISGRAQQGELEVGLREELERLSHTLSSEKSGPRAPSPSRPQPSGQAASIIDALRAPSNGEPPARRIEPTLAAEPVPPQAAPVFAAPVAAPVPAPPPPAAEPAAPAPPPRTTLGRRPVQVPVERIVTLFVVAREGRQFESADLVVAAEKAGLEFGDLGIYHRLIDGRREAGPIFSVANMLKPGNFDLSRIDTMRTPGLSFFMALPAPLPALDAWDAMLPTAQRMAELLDGQVLDEERNALGRQRVAHIRDELRAWDRDHEGHDGASGR